MNGKKMYIIIHNPAEVDATISVFSTKDEYNEAVREAEENAQVAWDEDTPQYHAFEFVVDADELEDYEDEEEK